MIMWLKLLGENTQHIEQACATANGALGNVSLFAWTCQRSCLSGMEGVGMYIISEPFISAQASLQVSGPLSIPKVGSASVQKGI